MGRHPGFKPHALLPLTLEGTLVDRVSAAASEVPEAVLIGAWISLRASIRQTSDLQRALDTLKEDEVAADLVIPRSAVRRGIEALHLLIPPPDVPVSQNQQVGFS